MDYSQNKLAFRPLAADSDESLRLSSCFSSGVFLDDHGTLRLRVLFRADHVFYDINLHPEAVTLRRNETIPYCLLCFVVLLVYS